jgi:hypothetical protein
MPARLKGHGPLLLVIVGPAMAIAAAGVLSDALAVTFAILGVGLLCLGVFGGRLAPGEAFEIGPSGLKAVLTGIKRVAERENRPGEAKVLADFAEAVDDAWFADYLTQPRDPDPYVQARRVEEAWRRGATRTGRPVAGPKLHTAIDDPNPA